MRRPKWVPATIWEAYLEARKGGLPERSKKTLAELMADPECVVVWRAIDRRRGTEFKKFRLTHGFDAALGFGMDDIATLLCRIPIMAMGLSAEDKMPAAKRSRQGNRIARAASQLHAALLETKFAEGDWPHPFLAALTTSFWRETDRTTSRWPDFDALQALARCLVFDPNHATQRLCEAIVEIGRAGESWARWKSIVGRPQDPNSARLCFIRELTAFFRRMYGTPMRESVAALTRSIYKCDIGAATVAKLAP